MVTNPYPCRIAPLTAPSVVYRDCARPCYCSSDF